MAADPLLEATLKKALWEEDALQVGLALIERWLALGQPADHMYHPSNIGKLLAEHGFWTDSERQCVSHATLVLPGEPETDLRCLPAGPRQPCPSAPPSCARSPQAGCSGCCTTL